MTRKCDRCDRYYDDEHQQTYCPHAETEIRAKTADEVEEAWRKRQVNLFVSQTEY